MPYTIQYQAAPVSYFTAPAAREGEPPVVMISQAMRATPLLTGSAASLKEAVAAIAAAREALIAEDPTRAFAFSAWPIGRKPPGFDAARLALRPSYVPPAESAS